MKILCLCFYFEPDLSAGSFKNSALVKEIANQLPEGSEVEVLTTLPNRYASYEVDAPADERRGKVRIRRVPLPGHQSGMLDQSRAFATYARAVMKITRSEEYDMVYSSSSRLMMAVLGAWISSRKHIPFYLDIRDLFVDTIKDVLPRTITFVAMPFLSRLEKWAVRRASRLNVVSGGFIPYFEHHFPGIKMSHFTNGIDEEFLEASPLESKPITRQVPEILYAGNMGEGQGLHNIIPDLAKKLEGRYSFKLIGSGGRLERLKENLKAAGCNNVTLEEPVPRQELIHRYEEADILFLHLNDYEAFKKVLPSKIFEYGALGKPVWAGVGGYSANFIQQHLSNSAVFQPCDVNHAQRSLDSLQMKTEPRHEFNKRFARRRIIRDMAAEIIGTAQRHQG